MTPFGFLETDILLNSISRDPSEAAKRERSITLLERDGRIHYRMRLRPGLVETWLRFPVQDITRAVLIGALDWVAASFTPRI